MLLAGLIPVALQVAATTPVATVLCAGDVVPHGDVLASLRARDRIPLDPAARGRIASAPLRALRAEREE